MTKLDPIAQLDTVARETPKTFAFTAKDAKIARQWQRRARDAVCEAIGFQDLPRVPLRPKLIETTDRGDFVREKIILQTTRASEMPVYVLTPQNPQQFPRPLPCVLALHGHGYGVRDIAGIRQDGTHR